mmetsp:Transcript_120623/g.375007  ORF Transcript_120623/g.375007 Transcript_120623/m.375007 type:complete len:433 (-) Transcript_120623:851-2149(-)
MPLLQGVEHTEPAREPAERTELRSNSQVVWPWAKVRSLGRWRGCSRLESTMGACVAREMARTENSIQAPSTCEAWPGSRIGTRTGRPWRGAKSSSFLPWPSTSVIRNSSLPLWAEAHAGGPTRPSRCRRLSRGKICPLSTLRRSSADQRPEAFGPARAWGPSSTLKKHGALVAAKAVQPAWRLSSEAAEDCEELLPQEVLLPSHSRSSKPSNARRRPRPRRPRGAVRRSSSDAQDPDRSCHASSSAPAAPSSRGHEPAAPTAASSSASSNARERPRLRAGVPAQAFGLSSPICRPKAPEAHSSSASPSDRERQRPHGVAAVVAVPSELTAAISTSREPPFAEGEAPPGLLHGSRSASTGKCANARPPGGSIAAGSGLASFLRQTRHWSFTTGPAPGGWAAAPAAAAPGGAFGCSSEGTRKSSSSPCGATAFW